MRISDWSSDVCSSDLVGHRDQVGQERDLEGGVGQQHPGMPLEAGTGFEEDAVEVLDRVGERGQAEVEGAEADRDEVVDRLCDVALGRGRHAAPSTLSRPAPVERSEEHTSELQSLMRNSYAVFC